MKWKHPTSLKTKKFKPQNSAHEVMLLWFWDCNGQILEHYFERDTTVTAASYAKILKSKLKLVIRKKRRGLLTKGGSFAPR
jgi:hypothetical protein